MHFRMSQRQESVVVTRRFSDFQVRHAYARSRESRENNDSGQDYLTYSVYSGAAFFCVCDGVGLSFNGQLASRFLGDSLLQFMERYCENFIGNVEEFASKISAFLDQIVGDATDLVSREVIPPHIKGIHREVLEENKLRGSESMFVCGMLRRHGEGNGSELLLAASGNIRVRCLNGTNRLDLFELPAFRSVECERWSTHKGLRDSSPFVYHANLDTGSCLQVYTDGLSICDDERFTLTDTDLNRLLKQTGELPDSDDCVFFELGCFANGNFPKRRSRWAIGAIQAIYRYSEKLRQNFRLNFTESATILDTLRKFYVL